MIDTEVLDDLLAQWQDSIATGRELDLTQLCSHHPEFAPELERGIHILRLFDRLMLPESTDLTPATGVSTTTGFVLPERVNTRQRGDDSKDFGRVRASTDSRCRRDGDCL